MTLLVRRADLERIYMELAHLFEDRDPTVGEALAGMSIDPDDLIEFVNEHVSKIMELTYQASLRDVDGPPREAIPHISGVVSAIAMFHMGWEVHKQLGPARTEVVE